MHHEVSLYQLPFRDGRLPPSAIELSDFSVTPCAQTAVALWTVELSLGTTAEQSDTLFTPFLFGLAFDDPGVLRNNQAASGLHSAERHRD